MPTKRTDKDYMVAQIKFLYPDHTAPQIATILSADPNVQGPVTVSTVRNELSWIRKQHETGTKEKPWTEEDHKFLMDVYEAGATIPNIAQRLGRSIPAIHSRISQFGLANRKITDLQAEAVRILLHTTQDSLSKIAYQMGIPYAAVKHVWNQVKPKGQRRKSDTAKLFWEEGSLAEKLLRKRLGALYGDYVIPWQHNRDWSKGRGLQIDIPIALDNNLKFAIEINHNRTHAYRRNRDYSKRIRAEMDGWIWIPIWINEPPTVAIINESIATIQKIIEERRLGESKFYENFIIKVAELETQYYAPDQPPYDPKENVTFGAFWDVSDVDVVLEHYGKLPMEEIQGMLSTPRTRDAIVHKARALGLTKHTKNFTKDEDDAIQKVYPDGTKEEVLARLSGRTWQSITSRASRLGVRRRDEWTPVEVEILTNNYGAMTDEELTKLLPGRTADSIQTRAYRLGLKKDSTWSEQEDDLLQRLYPEESRQVIRSTFPHRSWLAIASRASRLGLRRTNPF